jgi:hypothetical protein
MCQAAYQIINPGKRYVEIHYSFGVDGLMEPKEAKSSGKI